MTAFDSAIFVPEGLELLEFQKDAVTQMHFFLNSNEASGVYNASEMGLGKSIEAIIICNAFNFKKVLIICPAVMRLTWEAEIRKWSTLLRPAIKAVLTSADLTTEVNYLIISYDLASKPELTREICEVNWDCLILDEAHAVKSVRAKRTKAVLKFIWPKCRYRICLSGTPFTQSVVDGYSLFRMLTPSNFPNFKSFVDRFSNVRRTPWGDKYYGVKNAPELSRIIRSSFYIRYRKDEVLTELPDKVFNKIMLPDSYSVKHSPGEKAQVEKEVREVISRLEKGEGAPPASPCLAAEKRLQGLAKIPAVVEFVHGLLEQELPVVLFAWHTAVIERLQNELYLFKPSVIQGSTPMAARQLAIERFQGGETSLFIGQMAAAGIGITLTRSSTVVLAELEWSPATISQAIDRVHRIGAKSVVNVYFFVVHRSIEERIISTVMEKVRCFNKVLEG